VGVNAGTSKFDHNTTSILTTAKADIQWAWIKNVVSICEAFFTLTTALAVHYTLADYIQ